MIEYHRTAFGLALLFRVHGSAVYRGMVPGLLSCLFCLVFRLFWIGDDAESDNEQLHHPYAIGVIVASVTFLLIFRTQQAYARYWEAVSAVHHMHSKWADGACHTACYHMQSKQFDHVKPPSFYQYPQLNAHVLTRERENSTVESERAVDEGDRKAHRAVLKSIETVTKSNSKIRKRKISRETSSTRRIAVGPRPLEGDSRLDGGWGSLFDDGRATFYNGSKPRSPLGFASAMGGRTPPLFLQELAHLTSLLSGVALATLRNDIEGAESPLDIYEAGSDWPAVDSDTIDLPFAPNRGEYVRAKFWSFLGVGRTPELRTRYNASRPLPVVGGVSAGEIHMLQMARGPGAKTQLCWNWLSEFIVREHLAGSLGEVGPPIISRTMQFLGDGNVYYNHARKIMFTPFPFPHAQLTVFFVLVTIPAVAVLMLEYTQHLWLACVLSFLAVTALAGIHEVARELENPFRNVPNELPLVTLQAQFNETLLTMYAGYHPDAYWRSAAEEILMQQQPAAANGTPPDVETGLPHRPPPPPPPPNGSTAEAPTTNNNNMKNHNITNSNTATLERVSTLVAQSELQEQLQLLTQRIEEQRIELEQLRQLQQQQTTTTTTTTTAQAPTTTPAHNMLNSPAIVNPNNNNNNNNNSNHTTNNTAPASAVTNGTTLVTGRSTPLRDSNHGSSNPTTTPRSASPPAIPAVLSSDSQPGFI